MKVWLTDEVEAWIAARRRRPAVRDAEGQADDGDDDGAASEGEGQVADGPA